MATKTLKAVVSHVDTQRQHGWNEDDDTTTMVGCCERVTLMLRDPETVPANDGYNLVMELQFTDEDEFGTFSAGDKVDVTVATSA